MKNPPVRSGTTIIAASAPASRTPTPFMEAPSKLPQPAPVSLFARSNTFLPEGRGVKRPACVHPPLVRLNVPSARMVSVSGPNSYVPASCAREAGVS